jgi:anti-sigma regulatory factor (Ser/Thr protein kinase)
VSITSLEPFAVTDASQVGQARRAAVRLAEGSDLSEEARGEVAIIATELANNLVRYGKNGCLFLQSVRQREETYVQMLAVDSGPGIADVHRSLQDGVSTGGTPGTGLGAVRRMSDDFDIYSTIGKGTLVLSRVVAARAKRPPPLYEWAAVSTAAPRETVCGDVWRILEQNGQLAVMVADGLGHGPSAAEAAHRAADLFDAEAPPDPGPFCQRAHQALAGSRGAALAVALTSDSGRVRYAGVGNIAGAIVGIDRSQGLSSQNGTVGLQMPRVREFEYDWPQRGILIMHSDGLTSRWSLDEYQGLVSRHPALIAGVLHRDCFRGRDDATVVVVKKRAIKAAKP